MRSRISWCTAVVLAASLLLARDARAQNRIAGIIKDETGEGIRGATITAQLDNRLSRAVTSVTDERGRFFVLVTLSGTWVLNIEAPGFASQILGVPVRLAGRVVNFEVQLERREAPETVGIMAGVDPKLMTTQLEEAGKLLEAGQYDQAITSYKAIKTRAPALTVVDLQLGTAYLRMKSYKEAEASFQELLKADEKQPRAIFGMGEVKEATGQTAEALDWYRKAAASDPLWGKPLLKLAQLARSSGDRDGAVRYLTQVVEVDPGSTEATEATATLKLLVDSR